MIRAAKYILFSILMFFNINAFATHLVGGEMNYKFIEKGVYEISLTVYRDCYLGVPDFDLPAYILVYEGNGNFLGYYSALGDPKVKLPVEIDDDCFVIPPSVCVEKKEYIFVGEDLDSNSSGYYLSYQRCCRNESILNAYADETDFAGDAGMNLYAYIPPFGELVNSNPVFKSFPPIAICVNKRIDFDHSATDIDGDSLSYRLCTPTDALNTIYPAFVGFNYENLPFRNIRWRNPYTLENLLGGDDPLTIDSVTGRLTGTPVKVGQFVVGVCVDEYRNGKKIGETRRDFQYNVAPCEKFSTSSFFVMDTICNSLDVVFKNESDGAVNYFWDFGDGVTSTEVNPVHTFPDFGTYKISLIAASSLGCADTMSKSLSLVVDNLDYGKKDVSVCKGDSAWLKLDINEGSIKEVHWMTNPSVYTADAQIYFLPEKEGWIYFDVYSTKGCVYNDSVFVELYDKPLTNIQANPAQIFYPQVVNLSTIEDKNYTYEWTSKLTLLQPNLSSTGVVVNSNQWVYLTVADKTTGCTNRDSIYLQIDTCSYEGEFSLVKTIDKTCGHATISLELSKSNTDLTHRWLFNDSTSEALNISFTIPFNLDFHYQLIIGEKDHCFDTIPMLENVGGVSLLKDLSQYTICDSEDTTQLLLELNIVSDSAYAVTWGNFTDTLYNSDVIPIRKEEILRLNNQIPVAILYDDNCILRDTVIVNFKQIQVNIQAQPTKVYKGQEVTLSTIPTDFKEYRWFPPDVLNADDIPIVNAIIEETTDFIVLAKDKDGCVATDTMKVEVLTECSLKNIFIPTAFTPNGDGVNDILRIRSETDIQIEYVVYNRWGEKVFETNDLSKGWDGYYKGKPADKGAYAYYLKIICEDKSELYDKGNITLIR